MGSVITTGLSGLQAWKTLQRIEARQVDALRKDSMVTRATDYLRKNIDKVGTAEALVGDYRMLDAVLSAFGLEADIANKAFIRQVLESNPEDDKSLVNRLSDKRYLRMAETLGIGSAADQSVDLGGRLEEAFIQREFERRVGAGDETLRLALNARRELAAIPSPPKGSLKTQWYEVMGNPPLRKVFEVAFGFAESFGKLPVERQNTEFIRLAERMFGNAALDQIGKPEMIDRLITQFLARSQLTETTGQNRYSAALALLTAQ
ncbi:MAG: DUF1217 domain-containing protein [Paracoccus sp. (in: a-proteobacteria)]|nr:DUF1217 domain-containing protein [Paracoccus sp. (in: a-proteobacteria)]